MIYFNNKKIKNKNKVNNSDRLLHLNNHKQRKHSIFNEAIIWIRRLKDYDDYKNNNRKQAIYIYIYICICFLHIREKKCHTKINWTINIKQYAQRGGLAFVFKQ